MKIAQTFQQFLANKLNPDSQIIRAINGRVVHKGIKELNLKDHRTEGEQPFKNTLIRLETMEVPSMCKENFELNFKNEAMKTLENMGEVEEWAREFFGKESEIEVTSEYIAGTTSNGVGRFSANVKNNEGLYVVNISIHFGLNPTLFCTIITIFKCLDLKSAL